MIVVGSRNTGGAFIVEYESKRVLFDGTVTIIINRWRYGVPPHSQYRPRVCSHLHPENEPQRIGE